MLLEVNVGPFAPFVGYLSALIAAVYAIWTLIWKKKVWKTPQDILPSTIRGLIAVILGIGIVFFWLTTVPETINNTMKLSFILIGIAVVSFILYYAFIRSYSYDKLLAKENNQTDTVTILGGLWLTKEAKKTLLKKKITDIQELFKGSAYNIDLLWSRLSQETLKTLIVIFYLLIVVGGTLGLSATGFVVQVKLTNKPAFETTSKVNSPGLDANTQK